MAKKKLTDLLREEVEKAPEINDETPATSADQPLEANEPVEQVPMDTETQPKAKHSTATKAELEATIADLRAALEDARHKDIAFTELKEALQKAYDQEAALKQQISDLQTDLHEQKKFLQKLQKELETRDHLKSELDKAKKAARQLAQTNEKLSQELETLHQDNETLHQDNEILKPSESGLVTQQGHRPVQKTSEQSEDFAKNSWLL